MYNFIFFNLKVKNFGYLTIWPYFTLLRVIYQNKYKPICNVESSNKPLRGRRISLNVLIDIWLLGILAIDKRNI